MLTPVLGAVLRSLRRGGKTSFADSSSKPCQAFAVHLAALKALTLLACRPSNVRLPLQGTVRYVNSESSGNFRTPLATDRIVAKICLKTVNARRVVGLLPILPDHTCTAPPSVGALSLLLPTCISRILSNLSCRFRVPTAVRLAAKRQYNTADPQYEVSGIPTCSTSGRYLCMSVSRSFSFRGCPQSCSSVLQPMVPTLAWHLPSYMHAAGTSSWQSQPSTH